MAYENRKPAMSLKQQLEHKAYDFDFYQAMRLIECWNADKPRFGASLKAADDPVRLCQIPELEFPVSTIAQYFTADQKNAHPRLAVNFMGLFGPHGPMPLHLTEYVRERLRHHHDPTLARFADIFHHRMMSLFYRAWANGRPTVNYDRRETDKFSEYVGALIGIDGPGFRNRDDLADRAKLFYAGHFAGAKHPGGLVAIIFGILNLQVSINEFVGEWMQIAVSDQTRLGSAPELCSLGQSALLGASVWGCQHKFRIRLGPMTLRQYVSLLPGGPVLPQLTSIVRQYLGDEFVWDVRMCLDKAETPDELVLGGVSVNADTEQGFNAQLGWSMWLGPRRSPKDADDLRLNPYIHPLTA